MNVNKFRAIVSIADQACVSLTNFALNLLLIQYSSKHDYGMYGIGYAVIVVGVGIQNAVISSPMLVLGARKPRKERRIFCAAIYARWRFYVCVAAGCCCLLTAAAWKLRLLEGSTAVFSTSTVLAATGALMQDFFRQYYYLEGAVHKVLVQDLCFALLVLSLAMLFAIFSGEELAVCTLLIYGLSTTVIGAASFGRSGLKISTMIGKRSEALKEAWQGGKWNLSGVVTTMIQNQSYVYLLASLRGPSAVADTNAARLLVSPIMLVNAGMNNVLLPSLSKTVGQNGGRAAVAAAMKYLALLIAILAVYGAGLVSSWRLLTDFVLPEKYRNVASLVVVWICVCVLQIVRGYGSTMLLVMEKNRELALATIISAAIAVAGGLLLIPRWGPQGSILAIAAAEFVLAVILWHRTLSVAGRLAGDAGEGRGDA